MILCHMHFFGSQSSKDVIATSLTHQMKISNMVRRFKKVMLKDWLLDDSLHETFEIRKKNFLINLIDFNPLHTFRQSFTGISPLKYVFLPFFISKHISLFLFIATKHDVICKTGQI